MTALCRSYQYPYHSHTKYRRADFFVETSLRNYQEQRNFPAIDGTSQLSAALKFGAIAIRTIWQKTVLALENSRSDEESNSI